MTKHLRIITQNLWHGLDHTRPQVMLPMETRAENQQRQDALIQGLKDQISPMTGPDQLAIVCLQEANPVRKLSRILARELSCRKKVAEANVGLRAGNFSYPFYLQEGLACLWSPQSFKKVKGDRVTLSAPIPEFKFVLGKWKLPISIQLAERRVALFMRGYFGDTKIGIVNLHIHHGVPNGSSNPRRMQELKELFRYVEDEIKECDLFFMLGDFNSEKEHDEYALLREKGFFELSLDSAGKKIFTWDKKINPLCAKTSVIDPNDPTTLAWDSELHQFDHIFVRDSARVGGLSDRFETRAFRLFDSDKYGAWVSDHFGLGVDLIWKSDS